MEHRRSKSNPEITREKVRRRGKKALSLAARMVILAVTAVIVLGAVLLIVFWDEINLDGVRRMFNYSSLETDEAGQTDYFHYTGDPNNSFATMDGGLLVCSNTGIQLFSKSGEVTVEKVVKLEQPVVTVRGDYAVIYDAGGRDYYILRGRELICEETVAEGNRILSASVLADGWFVLTEETPGYKASVTVFNSRLEPVVTENISSTFIIDGVLSPDHELLALAAIGQNGTEFESQIHFYQVQDGTLLNILSLGSDFILSMEWEKDQLWVQGEDGVYMLADRELTRSWTEPGRYLEGFSLDGNGFTVDYTSKFRGAGTGYLRVYTAEGREYSMPVTEEVLSVSACGEYVAVLTAQSLTVYPMDLSEVYASLDNRSGARRVLMREDGSAMLISTDSASLFIPG